MTEPEVIRQLATRSLNESYKSMKSTFGISIPERLDEVCNPQRVALPVYDMQVGILSQIANPHEITRQILKILTVARDAGVRVFFSRHLSLPKELMGMF